MTPRRVRFTATARRHVKREKQWWLENRIHVEVFVACHLYYTFDEQHVIVRALWGARRLHGPRLRP
ncbi:MAG: hypothetical protein HY048_19670 [Acidobacteria bacterium]|nr:hypothetical protein [Acidobacteriota bacterium]